MRYLIKFSHLIKFSIITSLFVSFFLGGLLILLILLILLLAPSTPARAEQINPKFAPQPNLLLKKIDYLIAQDFHQTSNPWSGYFRALNGKAFKTPTFYENTSLEVNIKTAIEIYRGPNLKLSLPMHFDNGYRAPLYRANTYLGFGVSAYYAPSRKDFITLHLLDVVQFGGKVTERPCYDSFRRAFHCGTGNAWTDVKDYLDGRKVDPIAKLNWRHLF